MDNNWNSSPPQKIKYKLYPLNSFPSYLLPSLTSLSLSLSLSILSYNDIILTLWGPDSYLNLVNKHVSK